MVKKGDVICTLDPTDYEEAARTQLIKVERARAQRLAAELDSQAPRSRSMIPLGDDRPRSRGDEGLIALGESGHHPGTTAARLHRQDGCQRLRPKSQYVSEVIALKSSMNHLRT